MSLKIIISKGSIPSIQITDPSVVVTKATEAGKADAKSALAITIPTLNIDQRELHYEQRRNGKGIQFRFRNGKLNLKLRQEIYMANNLSSCHQTIWGEHEYRHVSDNQLLLKKIDKQIISNSVIIPILINPIWHPRDSFDKIEKLIFSSVKAIFATATGAAVNKRDTKKEYQSVKDLIKEKCS